MKKLVYIILCLVAFSLFSSALKATILEGEEIIELDTIVQRTSDCDADVEVCLDVVFAELRNYEILLDGDPYDGRFPACNIDTIYKANFDNIVMGSQAPYELIEFEVDGQNFQITFNTFEELVDSIKIWDPISNWTYDTTNNEMISVNPPEIHFGDRIEFRDANNNTTVLMINQTFVANGTFFFFEHGWSEMIFRDTVNNCVDTVDVGVYCTDIDTTYLISDFDVIEEYCFEDLDLLGNIVEVNDLLNPDLNHIILLNEDSCLTYQGISNGSDTLFYEVCDDLEICDTNYIIIEIINAPGSLDTIIYDTVFVNQLDTFCFDLSYNLDSIYNACPELSDDNISFTLDTNTNCVIFEYLSSGTDTACIVLDYDNDIRDSFTFIVTGSTPELEIIYDSIFVGQTKEYCLDQSEIGDSIEIFEEYCLNTLGFISYEITDTAGLCIEYTGEALEGTDTLCFRICDENDVCDSTVIIITTIPNIGISETIMDSVLINFTDTICFENDLAGDIVDIENICPDLDPVVDFVVDSASNCVYFTGLVLDLDTACILMRDEFGNTDTNYLIIQVYPPSPDTTVINLDFDQDTTICISSDELAGPLESIENICPELGDENIAYSIDSMTYCINIGSVTPGMDTICAVVCDTFMVCDTQIIIVNVGDLPDGESITIYDTIYVNEVDSFCFEPIYEDIDTIINYCEDLASGDVNFSMTDDSLICFIYEYVEDGQDTACYEIIYTNGVRDSVELIITTLSPQTEFVYDTIFVNENSTYCLDTTELTGNVVSANEFCRNSLDNISSDLQFDADYCFDVEGIAPGDSDTLCMEICDDNNVCDTTYYIIYVESLIDTSEYIYDSILINFTDTICFENDLPGNIADIENICPELSGTSVSFELDTMSNCIYYTGISIGSDTACILIRDEFGNTDTNFVVITTLLPQPEFIYDTIYVNEDSMYCLDTTELAGNITSFDEFCGNTLDNISTDGLLDSNYCFMVTGVNGGGSDTLCIELCDDNGVCDTSYYVINVEETFDTSEYIIDSVLINFTDTICFENDLPGDIVEIENICPELSGSSVSFELDTMSNCIYFTGENIGTDTACILIKDEFGNTDTNFVIITTIFPSIDTSCIDIVVGNTDTLCVDLSELAGTVNTMLSICPESINEDVEANFIQGTTCIEYTGINADERDTMCIIVCDDFSVCDTSIYVFKVLDTMVINPEDTIIYDTILLNFTESYCFDTLEGNGSVVSFTNECPDQSGEVDFFLDTDNYCISYTGDSLGLDTACIRIEYENGLVDSITFIVTVVDPTPETINVDILVGESDTICLDLTELAGFPDPGSMIDFCDTLNGTNAQVDLDTMNFCVEFTGLEIGVDSSCIVICDNFNVCDTTYFIITVTDTIIEMDTLIANDDRVTTDFNENVVINVLGNDVIPDNILDTIFILVDPVNGMTSVDEGGFITYDPNIDFCGLDSFQYVICYATDCDTAQVIVEVFCEQEPEDLFIPQGFSPNGDNIGDTWVIRGLDQFPNTNVLIYNRWGNEVYESNDYQNDWAGTWDGNPLPDGTYFYLIDFRNGEDPRSGYVVILR